MAKVVLVLCLLSLGLAACGSKPTPASVKAASTESPAVEVTVAPVEARLLERTISLTGSLYPDERIDLSAEVAGRLLHVHVDFGHPVRKGQLVAELDTREQTLQLERARASVAQALARIGLSWEQIDTYPDSTPAIRQALAQMEDARSKFESASRLVQTGDISRERYIELEKTFRARQEALEAAKDDLRTQLAAIRGWRADMALIEKRIADARVVAPFDGAVSARLASPGQYLKENTPILTIVKTNPLRLRAEVPESVVASVRVGTELTFTTDALPEQRFRAVVRELNPSLEARSRSLTAEARLREADPRLRPGMFVQAQVVTDQVKSMVVPKTALYQVAGLSKVFSIREGQVVEHKVLSVRPLGDAVALEAAGLRDGDQVATSNLATLINGMKVTVKRG
jgi:RND family efflux transporter MFP subunit